MKKMYSIRVNLTEQDLYQLQNGEAFDWNWPTEEDDDILINIHLFHAEEDFDDEEEK